MKGKSVIEVVVVFLFMKLLSIWLDSWLKDAGIHYWLRNLCFGLQAILIPMAIIFITKRKWKDYGFSFVKLRFLIHYGFIGAMLMLLSGAGFGFLKSQNINSAGMKGSLLLSFIAIIMILLLGFLFRKADHADRNNRKPIVIYKLLILIALVLSPIVIAIFRNALTLEVIAWDAYFLFMVGFGEEIKYRGYFQSRINQEYGRPWKVFGISFGRGLIIVSLLFGLSHIGQFGIFNPFEGNYNINPWMGLQAFFGSLFFGLIREKSGSLLPSGLAHGVPNAFGQTIAKVMM